MTPERWAQIEDLFHRTADSHPTRRAELLETTCRNDPELKREVEALLSSDKAAEKVVHDMVGAELKTFTFPFVGKVVSHYRILDGLGGGGMGLIYRAQDIKLPRRVALKFLAEELAKKPEALARFEREAHSASALEHPNICPIYELGEYNGQPFIVMPLLDGQTVEQLIAEESSSKNRLPLAKVLDIAIQAAQGLGAAHEHGIIHRDIKPANIFVTSNGVTKILDFGVAKLSQGELEGGTKSSQGIEAETVTTIPSAHLLLSRPGMAIGTAPYMSPEQIRGENVDARTDLFSLGLVIYEMTTGKRAFGGDTWPVLQDAILRQSPKPAREFNPEVPPGLEDIIEKALHKNRIARYQTASDMQADLDNLQNKLVPQRSLRRWVFASAVVLILFVTGTVFILNHQKVKSVAPEIKLRQLTNNSVENPVVNGTISPDGKYLAYSDLRGMHLKLNDTGETRAIPPAETIRNQRVKWEIGPWFPDSTRFMVNAHPAETDSDHWTPQDSSIWIASVLGGPPRKLRDRSSVSAISPDGSQVSFETTNGTSGGREIWLMGSDGEGAHRLYDAQASAAICCFIWSSAGDRYLYISGNSMLSRDVKGGPAVVLFSASELKRMRDLVWLKDGRLVYSVAESEALGSACNYWTTRVDLRTGEHIEKPARLTNWPNFCVSSGVATADGKRLAFLAWSGFGTSYIADLQADGRIGNPRHFTLEDGEDAIADWTADSKTVIVNQNRGDHYGIYKQAIDSDVPEVIASSVAGGVLAEALLSRDGQWIIAMVWPVPGGPSPDNPSAPISIVRIPINGGPPEQVLKVIRAGPFSCAKTGPDQCVVSEQTEDHKQMVVTAFDPMKGRGDELARFNLDRDMDLMVDVLLSALSPDGKFLAGARGPEGPIEIRSLQGQPTHMIQTQQLGRLTGMGWAPNGKGLYVTRQSESGAELLYLDLLGHARSVLKCSGSPCSATQSPDGRHLGIFETKMSTNMWMMENFQASE